MIYLFSGNDVEKARAKAFEWVLKARAKEPQLLYARLAREEITPAALLEAASAGGLFVKRLLVLLDDPFQKTKTVGEEEASEYVAPDSPLEAHLELLKDSDNAIVILAPKLLVSRLKRIEKLSEKTYVFDKKEKPERGFNFGLGNALGAKDREKLWIEIVRALRAGDPPEMLHGLLHWKARALMERGTSAWSAAEARKLSLRLLALPLNARRDGGELSLALERFALSL